MRFRALWLLVALPILALAACKGGLAGRSNATGPWTLSFQAAEGDSWQTRTTLEMEIEGSGPGTGTVKIEMQGTNTVTAVADGLYTIGIDNEVISSEGTGQLEQAAPFLANTIAADQEVQVDSSGQMTAGQGATTSFGFPDGPVSIGDTWTTETEVPNVGPVNVTSKLVGVEEINGRQALKVEVQEMQSEQVEATGPVVFWIDPESGRTVKMQMEIRATQGSQTATVKLKSEEIAG